MTLYLLTSGENSDFDVRGLYRLIKPIEDYVEEFINTFGIPRQENPFHPVLREQYEKWRDDNALARIKLEAAGYGGMWPDRAFADWLEKQSGVEVVEYEEFWSDRNMRTIRTYE